MNNKLEDSIMTPEIIVNIDTDVGENPLWYKKENSLLHSLSQKMVRLKLALQVEHTVRMLTWKVSQKMNKN